MQFKRLLIAVLFVLPGLARAQSGEGEEDGRVTRTEITFQMDGVVSGPGPVSAGGDLDSNLRESIDRVRVGFKEAYGDRLSVALTNWDAVEIEAAKSRFLGRNLKAGENPELLAASFYVHSVLEAVALLPKESTDAELEARMTALLDRVSSGDAAKYAFLQVLTARMYDAYNDFRNPGQGSKEQQDRARALAVRDGVPFSTGDLSLMQVLRAAGIGESDLGGVCNDYAQALAKVATRLFPGQDAFVINQGTHFVLALNDGKTVRIIDNDRALENRNTLGIFPGTRTPGLRINQVIDGKLVQVANVSTATGALIDTMSGDSSPRLMTEPVGNRLVGHLGGQGPLRASVGMQTNGTSRLTLVLGQYEHRGRHSDFRIGVGGGADLLAGDATRYIGVFQASYRYSRILVVRPRFELASDSAVRIEGFSTFLAEEDNTGGSRGLLIDGISGGLGLRNGLRFRANPAPNLLLTGSAMIEHDFGPRSWGDTGGASAILDSDGIRRTLSYTRLLFNQAVVRVEVLKRLSPSRSMFAQGSYQGSNIGQLTVGNAGVEQRFGNGAVARAYGGYTLNSGGYRTKNSLLFGPQGAQVGVQVAKRNLSAGMSVSGIGGGDQPLVQVQAAIRIGRKRPRSPVILSP